MDLFVQMGNNHRMKNSRVHSGSKVPPLRSALAILMALTGFSGAVRAGSITVYPQNYSFEVGSTNQFVAYVPLSPSTVTWQVNGILGGNATVGTISATGIYQSPAVVPTPNVITVTAQSTAFASQNGSTTVTITRKVPHLWSVNPSQLQNGNYQVSYNGSNYAPDTIATANGADIATTYISPTALSVSGSASVGTIVFSARQPGAGAVTGDKVSANVVASIVTVAVSPNTATVNLGASQTFLASVKGNANTAVTWTATAGSITSAGVYTAPAVMPASSAVTVKATSVANPAVSAQAAVTLKTPPPPAITVAIAPLSASVQMGHTQSFTATVANSANTAVTWSVNGTVGGSAVVGTVTSAGLYTAPSAAPSSSNVVSVTATSVANPSASASASVTLTAPPPAAVWLTGARFLEQTSFGPTPATLAQVQQVGLSAYLQQQFSTPETPVFAPADNSMGELQQWVLYNYTTAPDQLRQRVAYALSGIIVTSDTKLVYANEIIPWLQILSHEAFGNYRQILRDISNCPSMGKYLDLANSAKPGPQGGANENYARELMQLFTIGEWMLNQDGSQMPDPVTLLPTPTYNQFTVTQVALALTGWTYATAPGATMNMSGNWEYFGSPMIPLPANHDLTQKSILGSTLPAGQSPDQDLDGLLNILFNHPNLPPFISLRLIRSLVTSNPSPAYVQRIAGVFANNGSGVRGDLTAVITAIIMDPEARQDVPTVNQGRLKEPILQISGLLRALNGAYLSTEQVTYMYDSFAQTPLGPPSVFSWYSPLYMIPKTSLYGPEFQIYTPSEAVMRGNFFYWLLTTPGGSATLDLGPFQPYGNDMPNLVEAANQALLYGRMDPSMKQALINAAGPGYDAPTRITTVLYLTALSGQYAVQY